MSGGVGRCGRAGAVTALGLPTVVLSHLLVTGAPPPALAVLAVAATALLVGALVPARSGRGALGTTALVGAVLVAGQAAVALTAGSTGCLPAVGRGAELGVRIGLLGAEGCPPGTIAAGALSQAAPTALLTAGVVLAGHVLVASAGGLLLSGARRCAENCAALLHALATLTAPPRLPRVPVAPRTEPVRDDVPLPRLRTHLPVALTHRGPPAHVTA